MSAIIAYCITSFSTFLLTVCWFKNAYWVLYTRREAVYRALEELKRQEYGYRERCGSPDEKAARHTLETSSRIYEQIEGRYNNIYSSPIYRIPGTLMGFRQITR